MVFPQKLKHRHAGNNCTQPADHISTGREIWFGSQLIRSQDPHTMEPVSSQSFSLHRTNCPPNLGLISQSDWRNLRGADNLSTSDLRTRRDVDLALGIMIHFCGIKRKQNGSINWNASHLICCHNHLNLFLHMIYVINISLLIISFCRFNGFQIPSSSLILYHLIIVLSS